MNPLVTIVVPSFCGESYIGCLVEDVIAQLYVNWELIVVGNGPDQSLQEEIVRSFAERDKRISYHSVREKGVSRARNVGVAMANGEWIAFADADDRVPENWIANLMDCVGDSPDVVAGGISFHDLKRKRLRRQDLAVKDGAGVMFDPKVFVPIYMSDRSVAYSPCSKLIRRAFLQEFGVLFDEDISVYEDGVFSLRLLESCRSIVFVRQTGYEYCFHGKVSAITRYHQCMEDAVLRRRMMIARVLRRAGIHGCEYKSRMDAQVAADSLDILLNSFRVGSPLRFCDCVNLARRLFKDPELAVALGGRVDVRANLPLAFYTFAFRMNAPMLCVFVFSVLFAARRIIRGAR